MIEQIEKTFRRLGDRLPGGLSRPGDDRYAAATAIWAKPVGRMPRAVAHCRTAEDVRWQFAPHASVIFRCRYAAGAMTGLVARYATGS
jgi:hypothetical protein